MAVTEGPTTHPTKEMTTYRMADGSYVYGDYERVGDTEWFEEDAYYGAVEVVRDVWVLKESTALTFHPEECPSCEKPWHGEGCTEEPDE